MKSSSSPTGKSKGKRKCLAVPWAAPERNSRIFYAEVPRQEIALYRFLLEGYDNLAVMSVVDRYRAVVRLRFLPAAEKTLRQLLTSQGARIIEPVFVNEPTLP